MNGPAINIATPPSIRLHFPFLAGAEFEAHVFLAEGEGDAAGGAVPVFADEQFCLAVFFLFLFFVGGVVFRAVEQADDVGVLLDGAGFMQGA